MTKKTAEDFFNEAFNVHKTKKYQEALNLYTKAIELKPNYKDAYNNRGSAKDSLGEYEQAIKDYTKAIELDPSYAFVYNNRGFARIYLEDYAGALRDLNKAIRLNPKEADYYDLRGSINVKNGELEKAISDYDKAISLDKNFATAYFNRGVAKKKLKKDKEAEKDFKEAVNLNPLFAIKKRDEVIFLRPVSKQTKNKLAFRDVSPIDGTRELAKVCADVIDEMKEGTETSFGIFGRWGRGKTYLSNIVVEELKKNKKHNWTRVDYHAWKYQETPASWAYLYEKLIDKYLETDTTSSKCTSFSIDLEHKWCKVLHLNWHRLGWGKIVFFIIAIVFILALFFLDIDIKIDFLEKLLDLSAFIGVLSALFYGKEYFIIPKAKELFKNYTKRPSYANLLGYQAEIGKEISTLFDLWLKKDDKVILFVDDIDRCSETQIIQIVDALRVVLEDKEIAKKLVVLIAIDLHILKLAIRHKYQKFELEKTSEDTLRDGLTLGKVAYDYLDKLFLLGIDQPDISEMDIENYYTKLTEDDTEKEDITSNLKKNKTTNNTSLANDKQVEKTTEALNLITPSPKVQIKEINKKKINKSLTAEEQRRIIKVFQEFQEKFPFFTLTPRNIKVFHYRFIMTKKIIGSSYFPEVHCEYLMKKLLQTHLIKRANGGGFTDSDIEKFRDKTSSKNIDSSYKELFEEVFEAKLPKGIKISESLFEKSIQIMSPY